MCLLVAQQNGTFLPFIHAVAGNLGIRTKVPLHHSRNPEKHKVLPKDPEKSNIHLCVVRQVAARLVCRD